MIVNFRCHLDTKSSRVGMQSPITLGVSVRLFLDEIGTGLRRADCPASEGGSRPISWRPEQNRRPSKRESVLPARGAEAAVFVGLWARNQTLALLGSPACLQLADCRPWDSSASIIS